jgi:hypothetical protein
MIVDAAAFVYFIVITVAAIVISIEVIGIVFVEQGIAAGATGIMILVTVMA